MIDQMNTWIGRFNEGGEIFWRFSLGMFVQVTVLVVVLLCFDLLLKRRARAITRYCLWSLVLLKLILPVQLSTPMSVAYWIAPAALQSVENSVAYTPIANHHQAVGTDVATGGTKLSRPHDPAPDATFAARPTPSASIAPATKQAATSQLGIFQWKAYALLAWVSIVAVLMALIGRKALAVRKIVIASNDATDQFRSLVSTSQELLGMKEQQVAVRVTDRLSSPAICGFWKPTILLPQGLSDRVDRDRLRLVFVHELAHWKRFDLQINFLQTFLQVIYFYNPAVWFANARLRRLREEAVDETVLVASRSAPQQYGNTLLDIAAAELAPAELTLRLIGVVESRRQIAARLKRIVGLPIPKTAKLGIASVFAIVIAALVLLPMAGKPSLAAPKNSATAQTPTPKTTPAKVAPSNPTATSTSATAAAPNLRGRLVDETGAPVTDAEIELMCQRNYRSQKTKSDKEGNYAFAGITDAGEYSIEIHSKRWVGIVDRKALPNVDLKPQSQVVRDFTLQRACALRVTVVDEHGQPVPNVSVLSSLPTDNQNFATRASTNKKGQATLFGLKPSAEDRLVATMGGESTAFTRAALKLTDRSKLIEHVIILPAGDTVTGKALCADGNPASGWRINAMPTWWHFGVSPSGQLIGADGSFSLPHVTPDSYNIIVNIPTGQRMSIAKPVVADTRLPAGGKPLSITVDYPSPGSQATISGHIEFTGGKLQRGMHIFANGVNNWQHQGSSFVEPGKQDFEIGPIPKGMYRISFDSTEIEPMEIPAVQIPSEKKLTVQIKVRGEITLHGAVVHQDDKRPVTLYRAQIIKIRTLKGPNYVQDPNWHDVKDPKGEFKFSVAGPGIYAVQVSADGFAMATSKQFNTETDGTSPIRIELTEGRPLVGSVVDEQGNSISGAKVFPLPNAAVMEGQVVGQLAPGEPVVEASGGKFTLPQLPPERGVIKVVHPEFAPSVVDTNAADNKPASGPLKVVLHPGVTVRGRVYDADGKPRPNADLRFQTRDGYSGSDDEKLGLLARATSDADGNYEVRHVPAQYCYVQRDDPWKSLGTVRHAILTANGKTQTLDFGGTSKLTGRIVVNGVPLANARLQLSGESTSFGIFKAYARTYQNGAFTFWGPSPGGRTLYFTTGDQSDAWIRAKNVPVQPGNQDLGDIECATATLSVHIEPESGATTDGASLQLQEFNPIWPFGNRTGKLRDHTNRDDPYVFEDVPVGKYELIYYRANQFTIRERVDIEPTGRQKSITVKVPSATASLTGKVPPSLCGPGGCRSINVWSADQRLFGAITPKDDGTYKLDNIPAGNFAIKDKDTRDSAALLTISLLDGEHKTLDITVDQATAATKPSGFAVIDVFTPDGVPIPGCEFHFDNAANAPELSSSQDGHMCFRGAPGTYAVTIACPGMKALHSKMVLNPVDKDGRPLGEFQKRVQLEPITR